MASTWTRFDRQAAIYDARTGVPPERRAEIVRAFAELTAIAPGEVLLELGAGTGQLGVSFPSLGVRYVGLEASRPMLEVFERRLTREPAARVVHADVDAAWPVEDGTVRAVFAARAVHLFALDHLVSETLRVACADGASFVLGRVRRDEAGVRTVLRKEMRARLAARGFTARDGDGGQRRALDAFRARGASPLGPVRAATWPVRASAASVLDAWREKPGLGGCEPPDAVKHEVLDELLRWAADRFGSPDTALESHESYVLEGVRLR